jgi:hypothetical protein
MAGSKAGSGLNSGLIGDSMGRRGAATPLPFLFLQGVTNGRLPGSECRDGA